METEVWIRQLLLGGLVGMLGQGMRVVIGLKKLHDEASQAPQGVNSRFSGSLIFVSLFIGFVAGSVAMLSLVGGDPAFKPTQDTLLGLAAAGYAGTDFIEGFIKRHLPAGSAALQTGPVSFKEPDQPAVG